MTPAKLQQQLRLILAQLELVSVAKITSYNPGGGVSEDDGMLVGSRHTAADHFRDRLAGVQTTLCRRLDAAEATGDDEQRHAEERKAHAKAHEAREQILLAAQREWRALTGRDGEAPRAHTAELDSAQGVEDAIRDEAPGKPADDVAARLGLSVFMVRRIYVREGFDPHDGSRPQILSPGVERARRAREMAERGMTERQIMLALGVAKSTVRRDLGRAA